MVPSVISFLFASQLIVQVVHRFQMWRHVFQRIVDTVQAFDPYFVQRVDATGRFGISAKGSCYYSHPRLWTAYRESTAWQALDHFYWAIIACFGERYLRAPIAVDITRLLEINIATGFPGMRGSIDYMHWKWRSCPSAWKGMFTCEVRGRLWS
jgi:hypothetical protein